MPFATSRDYLQIVRAVRLVWVLPVRAVRVPVWYSGIPVFTVPVYRPEHYR